MGTVNPRGAHECGALGSAQGCAQSSAVPLVVAHRIERNPDWKVFLNIAAPACCAPLSTSAGDRHGKKSALPRLLLCVYLVFS